MKFTELWTRKESFLKLTGEGLRDNMKDVLYDAREVAFTTVINRHAGYVYSIAIWKATGRLFNFLDYADNVLVVPALILHLVHQSLH